MIKLPAFLKLTLLPGAAGRQVYSSSLAKRGGNSLPADACQAGGEFRKVYNSRILMSPRGVTTEKLNIFQSVSILLGRS